MTETNYEHLVAAGDWPTWEIVYEDSYGAKNAMIVQPLRNVSRSFVYGVATMEDVPCVPDEDDEDELVVDISEQRTRELALLANAPDLLNAIRKAVMRIETLTGLHGDDDTALKSHQRFADHATWQALAEIECDLIRAYDAATDTRNV